MVFARLILKGSSVALSAASQIPAFREIIELGLDVCAVLAARHGVSWPEELGRTMQRYALETWEICEAG